MLPLLVTIPPKSSEILKLLLTRPRVAAAIIRFGARGMGPAASAMKRGDHEAGLRLAASAVLGSDSFANLSPKRLEQARDNLIEAEFLGSGFAPLKDSDIASMSHRTLLVGSERSPRLFSYLLDRLEELLPDCERAEIPDASHIVHEDNPDDFFEAIHRFLHPGGTAA